MVCRSEGSRKSRFRKADLIRPIQRKGYIVDSKLELVVVPVSDVDRAKAFSIDKAGFNLDVDHRAGEDFRVVQLTPPGSSCSIAIMGNADSAPGSVRGLHLVVSDVEAARNELLKRRGQGERDLALRGGQADRRARSPTQQLRLLRLLQGPRRQRLDGAGGQAIGAARVNAMIAGAAQRRGSRMTSGISRAVRCW